MGLKSFGDFKNIEFGTHFNKSMTLLYFKNINTALNISLSKCICKIQNEQNHVLKKCKIYAGSLNFEKEPQHVK